MKIKTSIIVGVFLASFMTVGSSIQAQQENDDPNWRERKFEERRKETEKLMKEFEETQRELEKLRLELPHLRFMDRYDYGPTISNWQFLDMYHGPSPISNSRFLDIYDYGPIPQKRGQAESSFGGTS